MKPTFLLIAALALTSPLATAKSHKSESKAKKPAPMMKAEADAINFSVKDANGSTRNYHLEVPATAGKPQDLNIKMSNAVAALAALYWAPRFYSATNVAVNSVEHKTSSIQFPYYLVNMTGTVGGSAQPLYALVLENGELVRPVEVSTSAASPAAKSKAAPKKLKS
ncbi:MAG TPA: hypothetical protein VKC60_16580 [Opitutaceae bacterium]|nr:hypothetical protein [Opitutaceae bacterium]